MDWEVCSYLSAFLAEGHRSTCSWEPMGQLGKQNLPSGIPMPRLSKDYLTSWCPDVRKLQDFIQDSRPQASFLQESSFNPSLGLASLSASCVPKVPTFPCDQQPPDGPWRSEAGQRPWGCSQTAAESSPTVAMEDSLAGLILVSATPNPALPQGLQCQVDAVSAMETTVLGNHRWATHQTQPKDQKLSTTKGRICCLLWPSFTVAACDIPSLHPDHTKNLRGRNPERPAASHSLAVH